MSFSKFMKDKNRFQLIATTFSIVLVMIFVFFTSGGNGKLNDEQILQFIMKANSLVEMLRGYFPTLGSAIEALDTANILTSILGLLKLVGITLIIYIGYIWIAKKLYLKGAVGNLESGKKVNKKLNEEKAFKGGKLWKSYAGKEWKTLLRNPIFLMQCILPTILFPIIILGIIGLQVFSIPSQELNQISKEIAGNDSTIIVLIILGIKQNINLIWPTILGMINIVMYIGIGTLVTNLNVPVYVTLILLATLYIVLAMLIKKYIVNFKFIL